MAIAIFDDIGAIVIITLFYTSTLHWVFLSLGLFILLLLLLINYFNFNILLNILLGILCWYCILKSGIHPTITGVMLALTIPSKKIALVEKILHPWVAYFILPLFAWVNTSIVLHWKDLNLLSGLSLGIILGLFIGKQLGIFLSIFLSVKLGITCLPPRTNFKMIYGMALLCGIGFTMSLFISRLAFQDENLMNTLRAAILTGSLLSGITGYILLSRLKKIRSL